MNAHADRSQLLTDVITTVINAVNLQHVDRDTISPDTLLAQGGLDLDSVDILEVIVAIEQRFGLKVADVQTGKTYFRTIGTIADFIQTKATA